MECKICSIYITEKRGMGNMANNNNGGGLSFWGMVGAVLVALLIFALIG